MERNSLRDVLIMLKECCLVKAASSEEKGGSEEVIKEKMGLGFLIGYLLGLST